MFKHRWAAKESWNNVVGVLESPEKVLEFFISMKVGTCVLLVLRCSLLAHVEEEDLGGLSDPSSL